WERAASRSFYVQLGGSGVLVLLIVIAAMLASRDHRDRETQAWLRAGQIALATRLQGDMRLELLGESVLDFLAHFLAIQRGAVYVLEGDRLQRVAAHAAGQAPATLAAAEGLLGQAVASDVPLHVTR